MTDKSSTSTEMLDATQNLGEQVVYSLKRFADTYIHSGWRHEPTHAEHPAMAGRRSREAAMAGTRKPGSTCSPTTRSSKIRSARRSSTRRARATGAGRDIGVLGQGDRPEQARIQLRRNRSSAATKKPTSATSSSVARVPDHRRRGVHLQGERRGQDGRAARLLGGGPRHRDARARSSRACLPKPACSGGPGPGKRRGWCPPTSPRPFRRSVP